MIKNNRVSLWLGYFEKEDEFRNYMEVMYDEDGNYIPSIFQKNFDIETYELEALEIDWYFNTYFDIDSLLQGFSNDFEIIPQFKKMLENKNISKYNSIVLFYNFEYNDKGLKGKLEYIGCADVHL